MEKEFEGSKVSPQNAATKIIRAILDEGLEVRIMEFCIFKHSDGAMYRAGKAGSYIDTKSLPEALAYVANRLGVKNG